ncbi:SMI1/KNR4 family protein [Cellulomonas sp. URHB0016]
MLTGMFAERIARWGESVFAPPASPHQIAECEVALGHPLPADLRELLAETNGVEGSYGLDLVWSTERIARDNVLFRTYPDFAELYMPFDGLVLFADGGNGDHFAVALSGNREVFVWNHENDSRTWVASSVLRYLEEWMTGRLEV